MDACVKHQLTKVLIDNRRAHGSLSIMNRWIYVQFMASHVHDLIIGGKLPNLHLAYLGGELIDARKSGQMMARNRGISMFTTTNIVEAFQWLGIQPMDEKGRPQRNDND